jgi:hypothetical protein
VSKWGVVVEMIWLILLILAIVWRASALFVLWCISEHQMHVWILHSKRFMRYVYDWHAVEHHGHGMNESIHIDNGWDAYVAPIVALPFVILAAWYYTPYAWIWVVSLTSSVVLHRYLWNHVHRGIHRENDHLFRPSELLTASPEERGPRLEDHWLHYTWFFPFLERHHLIHHAKPNCNYSVVFAPYTDWVLGTLHGHRPWWQFTRLK